MKILNLKTLFVLSVLIFSGCETKQEKIEQQALRENYVRTIEKNKQLVEENNILKKNVAVKIVKQEGKEYLNINVLIGLIVIINFLWMLLYFRKGKRCN